MTWLRDNNTHLFKPIKLVKNSVSEDLDKKLKLKAAKKRIYKAAEKLDW